MGKGKKRERVRRKKKGREGSDVKGKSRNKERKIRKREGRTGGTQGKGGKKERLPPYSFLKVGANTT